MVAILFLFHTRDMYIDDFFIQLDCCRRESHVNVEMAEKCVLFPATEFNCGKVRLLAHLVISFLGVKIRILNPYPKGGPVLVLNHFNHTNCSVTSPRFSYRENSSKKKINAAVII